MTYFDVFKEKFPETQYCIEDFNCMEFCVVHVFGGECPPELCGSEKCIKCWERTFGTNV